MLARALEDNPRWNQQSLAHATGMDATKISRWLKGKNNPSDIQVSAVARLLGYDPRDFGVTDPRALHSHDVRPVPPVAVPAPMSVELELLHAKLDQIIDLLEHGRR